MLGWPARWVRRWRWLIVCVWRCCGLAMACEVDVVVLQDFTVYGGCKWVVCRCYRHVGR